MKPLKILFTALILILVFPLVSVVCFSCSSSYPINDSMVQVWQPGTTGENGTLLSFGVAVGDGSRILAVLNYTDDIPDNLEVVTTGKAKYQASIEVFDPRNSVALLKLTGGRLTPAKIADTGIIEPESEVIIHGWSGPDYNLPGEQNVSFPGYGNIFFIDLLKNPFIAGDGAVVTDKNGAVIGLIGTLYNTFVPRAGGPGMTAPIINIQNALGLLSPDATNQPWVKGPVDTHITTKESVTGDAPAQPPDKYNEMTSAILKLLGTMGEPLPTDEIPGYYMNIGWPEPQLADGTVLTVLFPHPVELRNSAGNIVAEAKWVGIQWGRSEGKPDRLFYGHNIHTNAAPEGGFILLGDISALVNAMSSDK
jgi:hypothetical protein